VAWRKAAGPPPGSAEAELLAYERACVAAGDAERLAATRSWLSMLRAAGGDPEVGEMFVAFAREDGYGVA
jgi:hypothetical protein